MRVLALLAARNEERFVGGCIAHLARHGLETYLIDNDSTDRTVELAAGAPGLAGIETVPYDGVYDWRRLLERKEELAASLDADWFLHADPDEIRLPPSSAVSLADALAAADAAGYDAVNFVELTFVPTKESPDHDHERFQETMRRYYPFQPAFPHRLTAWKRQGSRVDLASSGGHCVAFPGLRMFPESFPMRHYLFLSIDHARRKYGERVFAAEELAAGWHSGRAQLDADAIELLPENRLRLYTGDDELDPSDPWTAHPLFERRA
jgi:hypothetical protein